MRLVNKQLLADYRLKSCEICGMNDNVHAHHIKSRGSGGGDIVQNICAVCNSCHIKWHAIGTNSFVEKYPIAEEILISKGWKYDDFMKKWMRLSAEGWEDE